MKIETQRHGSHEVYGQKLVYVEYLASAPWNRKEIQRPPRYSILRLSLNREICQMLQKWNLGIGLEAAINVARARLLSRLQLPESTAIQLLETILMRDELSKQELIGDRQALGDLLRVLLLDSDWDEIATAAGNAVRSQVIEKVSA